MVQFKHAILAAVLATMPVVVTPSHVRRRRHLEQKLIVGFVTSTSVSDQARIDLDQQYIESVLDDNNSVLNDESFANAKSVYEKGGFSRAIATITVLASDLTVGIGEGDIIKGHNSAGEDVLVTAYTSASPSCDIDETCSTTTNENDEVVMTIQVQYPSGNCNVGGIPDGQQVKTGCLSREGTITLVDTGTQINYIYDRLTDIRNEVTLQGFSTHLGLGDMGQQPKFSKLQIFVNYYGDTNYADQLIQSAFTGTTTSFSNSNVNIDLGKYKDDLGALSQIVKRGTVCLSSTMYILQELLHTVIECKDKNYNQAGHLLDQALAFYAGSLEGTDGSGEGVMMHSLTDYYASQFQTTSTTADIILQFRLLQSELGILDCTGADRYRKKISQMIFLPLIQGTLYHSYKTIEGGSSSQEEADRVAFAASILPMVDACSSDDAATILHKVQPGRSMSSTDFAIVKRTLERSYECMGFSCDDIGGLWDPVTGDYYEGAGPCDGELSPTPSPTENNYLGTDTGMDGDTSGTDIDTDEQGEDTDEDNDLDIDSSNRSSWAVSHTGTSLFLVTVGGGLLSLSLLFL